MKRKLCMIILLTSFTFSLLGCERNVSKEEEKEAAASLQASLVEKQAFTFEDDQEIHFVDGSFQYAIRQLTGIKDCPITYKDVKNIKTISETGDRQYATYDLSVLQYFTGLEILELHIQHNSDLSYLSHLANLKELTLIEEPPNGKAHLEMKNASLLCHLTNLELLDFRCDLADLETLDFVKDMKSLKSLGISNEDFTLKDISAISNLSNLAYLRIFANIRDISAISNLTGLRNLSIQANEMADMNAIGKLTHVSELNIRADSLTDIRGIGNLTELEYLNM